MSYRCIYCVEALDISHFSRIVARRFFRNKRAAERAICAYKKCGYGCYIRKLDKSEHRYVKPDDVEG